jgi:hypothetical protein
MTERETVIEPDCMANDLAGEPMLFVGIRSIWGHPGRSIPARAV